ncbi:uncharacterized protein BJ212DRAFT_554371 [Suillus subaureus]|uniref:G domain-containing protein n=1 Tax=Suillus subaureus TaxID=48587 RepID=A0A9P7JJ02_9AGAM|nr:uncharacterized protein BJ212DRAFT_554371 [Suillus subaureus]KAG1824907.1 hypothetical protein BJ212DRAFT_554371 [Suillus subaureus]
MMSLEKVGPRGREDYDRDLRGWKIEAQKLGNSKPRTRKMAFIGRTGAGKSTAMNAILGAPVLSTRADVTCTSVQTEVFYEDLPPSTWRASIKFVGKDEWKKTLSNMLDDLDVYVQLGGGTSNIGHDIHDDSGPAMAAWGTLKEESPSSYFGTITWVLNPGVACRCRYHRCILTFAHYHFRRPDKIYVHFLSMTS